MFWSIIIKRTKSKYTLCMVNLLLFSTKLLTKSCISFNDLSY